MTEPVEKKRRATYQDILDAPAHKVAEIVNGELTVMPRPGGPPSIVASSLGMEIGPPFMKGRGGPGGWLIIDEPELHHGEDVVVPDLAGWRCERMAVVPDGVAFTIVPDWICEVLSRSTQKHDRIDKLPLYASMGVGHAWLVDPRQRSLEVFRQHEGKWLAVATYQGDARARIEPFEAIELELVNLWAGLPLRASEPEADYDYESAAL